MDNSRMIALSGFHQKKLPQSVVIIGAGASGLFAARRLRQLGLKQITLLEKEPRVGGKCSTYFDQDEPNIFIERGAGIICLNYGVVIDAMREKNIKTIRMPDIINNSSPIRAYYQSLDLLGKWRFAYRIKQEMWSFGRLVKKYRKSLQKSLPLPEELELPFANCAKKYNFEILSIILKKILTGFGYGDLRDCPTYSVLEYMGYSSIPLSIAGYFFSPFEPRCVQGGMQNFVQRIAEDFDVRTESEVMRIDRKEHVYVSYKNKDGILENIKADALILAVSPKRQGDFMKKIYIPTLEASIPHPSLPFGA